MGIGTRQQHAHHNSHPAREVLHIAEDEDDEEEGEGEREKKRS